MPSEAEYFVSVSVHDDGQRFKIPSLRDENDNSKLQISTWIHRHMIENVQSLIQSTKSEVRVSYSRVQLFATMNCDPQTPLSIDFSKQEYWEMHITEFASLQEKKFNIKINIFLHFYTLVNELWKLKS